MKSLNRIKPVCVICGTDKNIEHNHAGGRNHIAWFTVPFCERHHQQFHQQLASVGIDLRYTPNELERLTRASGAITICSWLLNEAMRKAISKETDKDK